MTASSVSTDPASPVRADETCAGKPEGATCWMQVYQRPGCYVRNQGLELGATVTWTGECAGGVAQGAGTLTWTWGGIHRTDTGRVVDGRPHGHWVLRYPNQESSPHGWDVLEGPYVNGMAHGHWLLRATTSGRTSGYFGEVEQRFRESGTRIPAKRNARRSVATLLSQFPRIGVAADLRDPTDLVFESTDES